MRLLVLGATGLLGNAVFRVLIKAAEGDVFGTIRSNASVKFFAPSHVSQLLLVKDLEDIGELARLLEDIVPDVLINCTAVGRPAPPDPMRSFLIHSVLPQRLAHFCRNRGCRLIHISSDGVFSGARGGYTEIDLPDANDVYGISKLLGEISDGQALTLRTSIIGHELKSQSGLLEWFLSQRDNCRCYTRAIFSGFPSVVLAGIIKNIVIPQRQIYGIYHVASQPISKFDLLQLVAKRYGKDIRIVPDDRILVDRSLNCDRFISATGYIPPEWPELIDAMYRDKFDTGGA